jgi:hypothetical protein
VLAEGSEVEGEGRGEPVVLSIEVTSPEVKKSGRVSCMRKIARPRVEWFLSSSQTADLNWTRPPVRISHSWSGTSGGVSGLRSSNESGGR